MALGSGGLLTFFSLNILSSSACRAAHTGTDTHLCQDSQTQQLKLYYYTVTHATRNTQIYTLRYSTSAYRSAAGRWPQADHSPSERLASASLLRHSLAVAENPPPRLPFPASPPSPNQLAVLKRRGRSKRRPVQRRQHGACVARIMCAHREEPSLVLRAGPDQLDIEAAARAFRAVVLELGDGAEPGACVRADGCGRGKVLVLHATSPRVGPSPHRAAGVLIPVARQGIVGAAAHLVAGSRARSASYQQPSTQGLATRRCAMT